MLSHALLGSCAAANRDLMLKQKLNGSKKFEAQKRNPNDRDHQTAGDAGDWQSVAPGHLERSLILPRSD